MGEGREARGEERVPDRRAGGWRAGGGRAAGGRKASPGCVAHWIISLGGGSAGRGMRRSSNFSGLSSARRLSFE